MRHGPLAVWLLILSASAGAQGAHEHGAATLSVAVDGDRMTLRFESPLDNLVGFETAPRNDRQRAAVRRMTERFRNPASLFEPSSAAACIVESVSLTSPALPAELLAPSAASAPAPASPAAPSPGTAAVSASARAEARAEPRGDRSHADLAVDIIFRCKQPRTLSSLRVSLFDTFPSVRRIDAAIVTAAGQSGTRLSGKQPTLTW